jgi:acyl-CoA synthetase (AMP-forming)/AMP-acid ligase II
VHDRLARFKTPRDIVFVDSLPRTATGKVLKRELRAAAIGLTVTKVEQESSHGQARSPRLERGR